MLLTEDILKDIEKAHNDNIHNEEEWSCENPGKPKWMNTREYKNMPGEAKKALLKGYDAYQDYMHRKYEKENHHDGNQTLRDTKGFSWIHPFSWEAKRAIDGTRMFAASNIIGVRPMENEDDEARCIREIWDRENMKC